MTKCICCGSEKNPFDTPISFILGVCLTCIRNNFKEVKEHIENVHARSRRGFGLPEAAPRDPSGKKCLFCMNECSITDGGVGFCGYRFNREGKIENRLDIDNVSWYFDPLPTNCVGDWVCPGGTGAGYPKFSHCRGPEYGYNNLAVFYQSCTFNCLFCQNWSYKISAVTKGHVTPEELASSLDDKTSCICYFGGDPTPQLPHSILTSKKAILKRTDKVLRICWETNGSMNPGFLKEMAKLALESGGCIKFDIKTFDEGLHRALCGVSNKRTLDNFKLAFELTGSRKDPPPLVASTPVIPGYIDEEEVFNIGRFIAGLDPQIPYSLLVFHPQFLMEDIPITSKEQITNCFEKAKEAGLKRVKIGNIHLL